jgi:hypothetical protein
VLHLQRRTARNMPEALLERHQPISDSALLAALHGVGWRVLKRKTGSTWRSAEQRRIGGFSPLLPLPWTTDKSSSGPTKADEGRQGPTRADEVRAARGRFGRAGYNPLSALGPLKLGWFGRVRSTHHTHTVKQGRVFTAVVWYLVRAGSKI